MAAIIECAEDEKKPIPANYYGTLLRTIRDDIPHVRITRVFKIKYANRFSHAAFQLKKAEFETNFDEDCSTETLYHATGASNVSSILKDNLDWRRVSRFRYGVGVSFSDRPSYANVHCNRYVGPHRAFIVCEVLIGRECEVSKNYDEVPDDDEVQTYRSSTNRVVVKFEDDTFYPRYVVYYNTDGSACFKQKWLKKP